MENEVYKMYRNIIKKIYQNHDENCWKLPLEELLSDFDEQVAKIKKSKDYVEMRTELERVAHSCNYSYYKEIDGYASISNLRRNRSKIEEGHEYCDTLLTFFLRELCKVNENIKYDDVKNNLPKYLTYIESKPVPRILKETRNLEACIVDGFKVKDETLPISIMIKKLQAEECGKVYTVENIEKLTIKEILDIA